MQDFDTTIPCLTPEQWQQRDLEDRAYDDARKGLCGMHKLRGLYGQQPNPNQEGRQVMNTGILPPLRRGG